MRTPSVQCLSHLPTAHPPAFHTPLGRTGRERLSVHANRDQRLEVSRRQTRMYSLPCPTPSLQGEPRSLGRVLP